MIICQVIFYFINLFHYLIHLFFLSSKKILVNLGFNIGCANILKINPLDRNGYLLIFTENQLCIAKIIVMYELKGGKHALVDNVNTIDTLSYISVCLFVHVYRNRLFTNDCSAGGKLYAHITPKEVIYYFGKNFSFSFQNNFLSLDENFIPFLIMRML